MIRKAVWIISAAFLYIFKAGISKVNGKLSNGVGLCRIVKGRKQMDTFGKIYEQHRLGVFRYLYFLSGDAQLAEDLTQETFLQAFLSLRRFRGESSIFTWIIAIARRVYLKHQRRGKRFSQRETGRDGPPASDREAPEMVLGRQEREREIRETLRLLPEEYRSVLIWREIEGLSFAEIGAILGKSPPTVRVILFRAKKRFRELYRYE